MKPGIVRAGAEVGLGSPADDPLTLMVSGRLFIEAADGRRLRATGGAIGVVFGGGRSEDPSERVTRRDIENTIDALLARDPELRPPRLAWEQLNEVLEQEGIAVTEDELSEAPFVLELSDELLAELDR